MMVGALLYLPLMAQYRQNFLEERIAAAQMAALATDEAEDQAISPRLEGELLDTAGVIAVVMRRNDRSFLLGGDVMPHVADASYDLTSPLLGELIMDAVDTLEAEGNRVIRVVGTASLPNTRFLEITLDEQGLYDAMVDYSRAVLILSGVISIFTGILVYLALHWLMVRPMRRIKDSLVAFRESPEDKESILKAATRRRDEIGLVERELSRMQEELRQNLHQKSRLAELGEAVAKINHDLRNILATAQLASDGLKRVEDPRVQKVSKRLVSAIGKAVKLCERTMRHGKADEPLPEKRWINLYDLVEDVSATLGFAERPEFTFKVDFDKDMTVLADPDQFQRVIMNLCRNASDVQGENGGITIRVEKEEHGLAHIRIIDQGPGVPEHAQETLFKAFASARSGGTGLGLSIAQDIVIAHGGAIGLENTGPEGSTFIVCLPGA
jgi:signal transduction histidine kinase